MKTKPAIILYHAIWDRILLYNDKQYIGVVDPNLPDELWSEYVTDRFIEKEMALGHLIKIGML